MATCRVDPSQVQDQALKHEVHRSLVEIHVDPTAGTAEAEFRFDPDLSVFKGHFPDLPIVPGVFLIEASRLLAEHITETPLCIEEVRAARFTGEVHPGDRVMGIATIRRNGDTWTCDATFETDSVQAAKLRLVLGSGGRRAVSATPDPG